MEDQITKKALEMAHSERLPCVIPFCKCTSKRLPNDHTYTEWICQKHWRMIDKSIRREKSITHRQAKKDPSPENIEKAQAAWEKCKEQASSWMMK